MANPLALIGDNTVNTSLEKQAIADDVEAVGFYFSAHWCPPCRGFTPQLKQYYDARKGQGKKIEIVFVSSDRDEPSFKDYFTKEMSWLALPYSERDLKQQLSQMYGVTGIPTLIIVNRKTGELIDKNGRGRVTNGQEFV